MNIENVTFIITKRKALFKNQALPFHNGGKSPFQYYGI